MARRFGRLFQLTTEASRFAKVWRLARSREAGELPELNRPIRLDPLEEDAGHLSLVLVTTKSVEQHAKPSCWLVLQVELEFLLIPLGETVARGLALEDHVGRTGVVVASLIPEDHDVDWEAPAACGARAARDAPLRPSPDLRLRVAQVIDEVARQDLSDAFLWAVIDQRAGDEVGDLPGHASACLRMEEGVKGPKPLKADPRGLRGREGAVQDLGLLHVEELYKNS